MSFVEIVFRDIKNFMRRFAVSLIDLYIWDQNRMIAFIGNLLDKNIKFKLALIPPLFVVLIALFKSRRVKIF